MNSLNSAYQKVAASQNLEFQLVPNKDATPLSNQFFVITPTTKDLHVSQTQLTTLQRKLIKDLTDPQLDLATVTTSDLYKPRKFKIQLCHMPNSTFVFSCSIINPNEPYLSLARILGILFPPSEFTICTVLAVDATEFSINCEDTDVFNVQLVGFMLRTASKLSELMYYLMKKH
ncbi:unnamed protein product [Ambrosiozyma monospora]|uniref:Unnamed protein product n=1 Tax=Ambrosiozyma monospora TaxID=43982 RepID=A0ACB5U5U5_AMBMO|nr:unnamed protein product [Ambrosiozyma monospora]